MQRPMTSEEMVDVAHITKDHHDLYETAPILWQNRSEK